MPRYIDATPKYTDSSNEPLPNGLLYFFESGTNTQKTTYADVNQTIANPHPLVLNGDGSVPNCFYSGAAKVILADSDDVQIWERDPVVGAESSSFGDSWDAISVYGLNEVVTFNDLLYTSIVTNNQNNNPASAPEAWSQFDLVTRWNVNETYQSRDPVIASDANIYTSLSSDNLGNDPISSPSDWQATGTGGAATTPFLDWDGTVNYGAGTNNIVEGSDGNYYVSISTPNFNEDPTTEPTFWTEIDFIEGGNITIIGDTIASTDTDSDINVAPNGTGTFTYNGVEIANTTQLAAKADTTYVDAGLALKADIAGNENITGLWEWQDNIAQRFGNGADIEVSFSSSLNAYLIDLSSSADFLLQDNGVTVLQYDNSAGEFIFSKDIDVDSSSNYSWAGYKKVMECQFDIQAQSVDGDVGVASVQAGQPGGIGTIDINLSTPVTNTAKAKAQVSSPVGLGNVPVITNYLFINTSRVRVFTSTVAPTLLDWFGSIEVYDGGA